jgi:hypothetical protein
MKDADTIYKRFFSNPKTLIGIFSITSLLLIYFLIISWNPNSIVVDENGIVKRGYGVAGRVLHHIAPKIQGEKFWLNQLDAVEKQISLESKSTEQNANLISEKIIAYAKEKHIYERIVSERLESLSANSVLYSEEKQRFAQLSSQMKSDLDKEIQTLRLQIEEQPKRLKRLYEIKLAIKERIAEM